MKKKIRLKRVQSLHPVSQMHHRTMWAEGSPPYPTDADVLSFYCPSWSQLCCLQNQTPPLVSLSLSSLHALHHPSSLHLSWNTAGGWSFVNVTNQFYRPRTSASSSQCFITLLIFQSHLWLDLVNKIDRQARSQSLWDVASLQTTDWLREPLPLLRGGGVGVGWRPIPLTASLTAASWARLLWDCGFKVCARWKQAATSFSAFLKSPKPIRSSPDIHTHWLIFQQLAPVQGIIITGGAIRQTSFCRRILKPSIQPLLTISAWKIVCFIYIHRKSIHILVIYILFGI